MSGSHPMTVDNPQTQLPPPCLALTLAPSPFPAPFPAPAPAAHGASAVATASSMNPTRLSENFMHKNRLQEYTQRSSIALPRYEIANEGLQHAPKFRATVTVDGQTYTSTNTFAHRRASEQDVAKLALECISKKIKEEGSPLIVEDTVYCKSILNEFAVKMSLERPTYKTIQPEGSLPVFVSSLVFDGVNYTGEPGKSKKEAEQLAARAVIRSVLGTSGYGTLLFEIIKSKGKLFDALRKVKNFNYGTESMGLNTRHNSVVEITDVTHTVQSADVADNVQVVNVADNVQVVNVADNEQVANVDGNSQAATFPVNVQASATPETSLSMALPHHQFMIPKSEPGAVTVNLPISFVPSVLQQPSGVGPSTSKKRRKNKNKANKRLRADSQSSIVPQPYYVVQ